MRKILVIGGGSIGERHMRCFLRTNRAELSLCDISQPVRQRIAGAYGITGAFESLEDALTHHFDGAVICTPAHLHVAMARQLAQRGVNLLIEKPLSTLLDDVELNELISLVKTNELAVAVAYVLRLHPALQALKQAIESNRFGRPVEVVINSGQHFPFYRPAYRDIYYARHETGGGAIQDALAHFVNAAEWLVGPVTKLVADAEHCVLDGVDVEDTVHLITRHASVLGSVTLNQHQSPNEVTFSVIGEKGVGRCELHHNRWLTCIEPDAPWVTEAEFEIDRDDLFFYQANMFLDLMDGSGEAPCPLVDAIATLRVNLAVLRSVAESRWIEL